MPLMTTKQDLADVANAGLQKKVPFPPGKIVDVEIVESTDARGNTAINITTDNLTGKQIPNNYPDTLRYATQTRFINRTDISKLDGALRTDGTTPFTTVPAGTVSTQDLAGFLSNLLSVTIVPTDIVDSPIPEITTLTRVYVAIDPYSLTLMGAVALNLLPPALSTPTVPPVVPSAHPKSTSKESGSTPSTDTRTAKSDTPVA